MHTTNPVTRVRARSPSCSHRQLGPRQRLEHMPCLQLLRCAVSSTRTLRSASRRHPKGSHPPPSAECAACSASAVLPRIAPGSTPARTPARPPGAYSTRSSMHAIGRCRRAWPPCAPPPVRGYGTAVDYFDRAAIHVPMVARGRRNPFVSAQFSRMQLGRPKLRAHARGHCLFRQPSVSRPAIALERPA